ncbi:unnamed protein product, partial [Lampetra fluviatilis]
VPGDGGVRDERLLEREIEEETRGLQWRAAGAAGGGGGAGEAASGERRAQDPGGWRLLDPTAASGDNGPNCITCDGGMSRWHPKKWLSSSVARRSLAVTRNDTEARPVALRCQ